MNKIIENIVKNVLHLTTIIFILVVALQLNKEEKIEISQENKKTQEIINKEEINMKIKNNSSAVVNAFFIVITRIIFSYYFKNDTINSIRR
jgi:hypothetical protein